jgi:hypothetical protein
MLLMVLLPDISIRVCCMNSDSEYLCHGNMFICECVYIYVCIRVIVDFKYAQHMSFVFVFVLFITLLVWSILLSLFTGSRFGVVLDMLTDR